ncbi:MAG: permease, partial [Desulfovibrionales bacterium]
MQDWSFFVSIVIAIVIEAAPFLLIGSLISAVLAQTGSGEYLARRFPKSRTAGIGAGLLSGMILPTCECGVVPVARRFLDKGVPPHAALTYMLAAPVINPVVLVATYVAFQGNMFMVWARVAVVGLAAACIGLAF